MAAFSGKCLKIVAVMVLERMTPEEIDFAAAHLENHEKASRRVLGEIRDQITLYGYKSKVLCGNVFRFALHGRAIKVEKIGKVQ